MIEIILAIGLLCHLDGAKYFSSEDVCKKAMNKCVMGEIKIDNGIKKPIRHYVDKCAKKVQTP